MEPIIPARTGRAMATGRRNSDTSTATAAAFRGTRRIRRVDAARRTWSRRVALDCFTASRSGSKADLQIRSDELARKAQRFALTGAVRTAASCGCSIGDPGACALAFRSEGACDEITEACRRERLLQKGDGRGLQVGL